MENKRINIVLIDDQQLFREGIRQILQTEPMFNVLGTDDDISTAIEFTKTHLVDLLLIDKNIFQDNQYQIEKLIDKYRTELKFVILSTLNDENIIIEAIKLGVHGYLLKEMDINAFIQAIQMIYDDVIYIHPRINEVIIKRYLKTSSQQTRKSAPVQPPLHLLTRRESEVIQLLAKGKSNLAIAEPDRKSVV